MNKVFFVIKYCIQFNKLRILKLHAFVALRVEDAKEGIIFFMLHAFLIYNYFGILSALCSLFLASCLV